MAEHLCYYTKMWVQIPHRLQFNVAISWKSNLWFWRVGERSGRSRQSQATVVVSWRGIVRAVGLVAARWARFGPSGEDAERRWREDSRFEGSQMSKTAAAGNGKRWSGVKNPTSQRGQRKKMEGTERNKKPAKNKHVEDPLPSLSQLF